MDVTDEPDEIVEKRTLREKELQAGMITILRVQKAKAAKLK